jgi:uncharacterized protein (DUF433 family)
VVLSVHAQPVPISLDAEGTARIGQTRVTLDTIVAAFEAGATAEEIQQQYPTVSLPNVYATLAYYLAHRAEVDEYLRERRSRAAEVRAVVEAALDPAGIRARLLARRGH